MLFSILFTQGATPGERALVAHEGPLLAICQKCIQKTEQEIKHEKKVNRLKEIKKDISKPKQLFEYNDLKTELTGQPNPNNEIGSSMINRAIKAKIARNELENKKQTKKTETAVKKIQAIYKGTKTRQHLNNNIDQ